MGRWLRFPVLVAVVCLVGGLSGCGSSSEEDADDAGSGGSSASGGSAGSNAGSGGSGGTATGGSGGTGGSGAGAGGSNATGGSSATGGTSATGGSAGTAGSAATGNGGSSGRGGSSGSGGQGGKMARPDPETASELEACLYFVRVQCNKLAFECDGLAASDDPCPSVDADCPDRYFSPGAQLSVADLIECGDAWSEASCSDINRSVYPACPDAGTRMTGEACMFGSQCASWSCRPIDPNATRTSCGSCARLVDEGMDCLSPGVACREGFYCDSVCTRNAVHGLAAGSPCVGFYDCAEGNRCLQLPGESGTTCQPLPGVNEPCPTNYQVCAKGAYCCDFSTCLTDGLCLEAPPLGNPCDEPISNYQCGAGLHCDAQTLSNVCTAPIAAGGSCEVKNGIPFEQSGCADGTYCRCNDATCSGRLGTCVIRAVPGEACTGANVECVPGSACEAGVCVPTGSQMRFAECGTN